MDFEITVLGTASASPAFGRNQTAQLLNHNQNYWLIDCGEGTQMQFLRYRKKADKLSRIFISHLHGDHYYGLPGLLSTLHIRGRSKPLYLYGPPGLADILLSMQRFSEGFLNYEIIFRPLQCREPEVIFENEHISVSSFPLDHRIPCTGFLFKEKERKRKILSDKLPPETEIKHIVDMKHGRDVLDETGKVILACSEFTAGLRRRSYAFCSDTAFKPELAGLLRRTDLLYHEATFLHKMIEKARQTFHSTARQAAEFAVLCEARQLLIGHYSARFRDVQPLTDEARSVFPRSRAATEGQTYQIPEEILTD